MRRVLRLSCVGVLLAWAAWAGLVAAPGVSQVLAAARAAAPTSDLCTSPRGPGAPNHAVHDCPWCCTAGTHGDLAPPVDRTWLAVAPEGTPSAAMPGRAGPARRFWRLRARAPPA